MKDKNHMNISIDAENLISIYDKNFKVGIESHYLKIIKVIYDKPIAHLILDSKKLKWLPLKMWDRDADPHHFYSTQYWKTLPMHLVKKKKRHPNWKRSKT